MREPKKKRDGSKFKFKKCYGTYFLLIINALFFGLEIKLGGSQNIEVLEYLGALSPNDILTDEWWRIISANFLHYGWLHLISNLLGLLAIGRIVESYLGIVTYLIIYFYSGVGAMTGFSILAIKLNETNQLAMGASGSIMGLVGLLCALLLRKWYIEKTWKSARNFGLIILIVIVQSLFDIATPQVSFIIHFFGWILGFLFGIILLWF